MTNQLQIKSNATTTINAGDPISRSIKAAFLRPGQPKLLYTPAAVATTATPTASATLAVAMTARSNATVQVSARIAQAGMANMAALALGRVSMEYAMTVPFEVAEITRTRFWEKMLALALSHHNYSCAVHGD